MREERTPRVVVVEVVEEEVGEEEEEEEEEEERHTEPWDSSLWGCSGDRQIGRASCRERVSSPV